MPELIVVHGSPGNGKSTISRELHKRLKTPWFEFGWIPEFTSLNPYTQISPKEEEQISFENLVCVCKNYIKHGFESIIISDLNDIRMLDIPIYFKWIPFVIFTLYSENDEIIKKRIMDRNNGNLFKNFEQSIHTNKLIVNRKLLPNEYRIRSDEQTVDEITNKIVQILKSHQFESSFNPNEYDSIDYYSYFNENGTYF